MGKTILKVFVTVILLTASNAALARYQALNCSLPSLRTTWAILDRNGAGAKVEPYLSSLAQGEMGTGVIYSPTFAIAGDSIAFTICGHDGPTGGRGENYIALVDAGTDKVLMKTVAPRSDAIQQRSWNVSKLKGAKVRIEVRDGDSNAGHAWLGIGRIDAAAAMKVDFSRGIPDDWDWPERQATTRYEILAGVIPFRLSPSVSSVIPDNGVSEFPCGFTAERLYFLDCTVSEYEPLATYGGIEIHYRTGSPEVFPLMCGFTLDSQAGPADTPGATHLYHSADPRRRYLAIAPRDDTIEKIRLVSGSQRGPIPRITAITCQTTANHDGLTPMLESTISPAETAWIESHTISADSPKLTEVAQTLRQLHGMPLMGAGTAVRFRKHKLDGAFRSEGVAVADFNGNGQPDIAAGGVYYAGPNWKMAPMLGDPVEFNRNGYSDAFLCFADDLNNDEAMDLIVVGFPGQQTHWLENPRRAGELWKKHLAVSRTGNESPIYADIDADGRSELIFMDQGKCAMARPGKNPRDMWVVDFISGPGDPAPGHGLGLGDVNGDGRLDVLIPTGWWRGPDRGSPSPWRFHKANLFGGAQLCVSDFDGDGDNDVLGSSAHGYGIAWSQQTPDGWRVHEIDNTDSQTHALHLADINRDGLIDFVTGKRFWAHNGHDPGSYQPAVLCWYEQKRIDGGPHWTKHIIDIDSGVGLHFQIADINGDGMLDIVTANKKGVYYFEQM